MRILILICTLLSLSTSIFGQDTLFINKHSFGSPVQNVFKGNEQVYVKTSKAVYLLEDQDWKILEMKFSKPYVFYDGNFYESDFIPDAKLFDVGPMSDLVPQRGKFIATAVRQGSRFFLASGSDLFEYEIRDHYSRTYPNHSIRDIYIEDGLKFIATYSGIYVNDSIKLEQPNYSNGPLTKIDSIYYLPWDEVSQFFPPDSMSLIPNRSNSFTGKARKIIQFKGEPYAIYTKSLCRILPGFELQSLHQGLEYLDLEVFGNALVFSTVEGLVLSLTEKSLDTLAQIPSKIKDVYPAGDFLYLASDVGVYRLKGLDSSSLALIAEIPKSVMVGIDDFDNLWIASENGLFVCSDKFSKPLTIIPDVEFNREAMLFHEEKLYVGGVNGLYMLDTYEMTKSYIPQLINQLEAPSNKSTLWVWPAGVILLIVIGLGWHFSGRNTSETISQFPSNKKEWDLDQLQKQILSEKILTVEALAEYLGTNPVQLNRNFKKLGSTPGKFLKKAKLQQAKNLLKEGQSLDEVAKSIGYSSKFLKDELGIV